MSRKDIHVGAKLVAVLATIGALGAMASPALAVNVGENVAGTTASSLSLTAGAAAVLDPTHFQPGDTATGVGALTAVDTSPNWTLQVADGAANNAGKLQATGPLCTGSDAVLTNPLQVSVSSVLPGVSSLAPVSLSGTPASVATASNQLLAGDVLTTHYTQVIPSTQVMRTGCLYTLTATYTLQ
jgi:hypothetical protein